MFINRSLHLPPKIPSVRSLVRRNGFLAPEWLLSAEIAIRTNFTSLPFNCRIHSTAIARRLSGDSQTDSHTDSHTDCSLCRPARIPEEP